MTAREKIIAKGLLIHEATLRSELARMSDEHARVLAALAVLNVKPSKRLGRPPGRSRRKARG